MNTTRQFWALLKFQTGINPFVWFAPLAISTPLLTSQFIYSSQLSFSSSLDDFYLFITVFVTVLLLAPELFQTATTANFWSTGTEFLLTRATDRKLIYRSKSTLLYLVLLLIPVILLFVSLRNPVLKSQEYSKAFQAECLNHFSGTTTIQTDHGTQTLAIPYGTTLVIAWNLWTTLLLALASQVFIGVVYPLKYRRYLFWAVYFLMIFSPMWMIRGAISSGDHVNTTQAFFFLFASHLTLAWVATLIVAFLVQIWCEGRFARLEQV